MMVGGKIRRPGELLSPGQTKPIFFFFNDTATTEIYTSIDTLSLHDALPIATVTEDADVEARVGATASLTTSGALTVQADADNDALAESDMGSGGVVGVTGGSLFAIVGGGVKAELDGDVTNAASVTVQADGFNNAKADALAIAVGLVAGSGASAYAEVTDQADVEALVGLTASLTVPGGAVQ